jgi:hypothetical protein
MPSRWLNPAGGRRGPLPHRLDAGGANARLAGVRPA